MRALAARLAAAGLIAASFPAAAAPDRPNLTPARDVDIVYRITRPQRPAVRERVRWQGGTGMERIDADDGSTATILDHRAHLATVLTPETRRYLQLNAPRRRVIDPDPAAPLARAGSATVADLPCTEWAWTNPEDHKEQRFCVTDDGVVLRRVSDGRTLGQAVSVRYHKLDPDLFATPSDYEPSLAPEGDPP